MLDDQIMTPEQFDLYAEIAKAWKAPPNMSLSEWSEEFFRTDKGSFKPTAYQKEILDELTNPATRETVFQKAARVGGTILSVILCLHDISVGRAVGQVQPRESDSRDFSSTEISPAIDRCPAINNLLLTSKAGGRDTMLQKSFVNGATWRGLSLGSAAAARRISLDTLSLDEIDAADQDLDGEGSPIDLFRRRLGASAMPRTFYASTPVASSDSEICRQYERGDKRVFECQCTECGDWQELQPEGLRIDLDGMSRPMLELGQKDLEKLPNDWQPEYACEGCGTLISETNKKHMVDSGRWRATASETAEDGVVSFRLNALVSPWPSAAWKQLATEWMRARGNPSLERVVANTLWGRAYDTNLDNNLTPEMLKARATPRHAIIPKSILRLTAAVDVGPTYLEVTILGHGPDGFRIVDHSRIEGDPTTDKLWDALDDYLAEPRQHELGADAMEIDSVGVDSGYATQSVYRQCSMRRHWYALKGVAQEGKPIWTVSKSKPSAQFNCQLFLVGTFDAKTFWMSRFAIDDPEKEGYLHFHDELPDEYYEQLLSEYRHVSISKGRPKIEWLRHSGKRSEALDTLVYAYAVSQTAPNNWEARKEALTVTHGEDQDSGENSWGEIARKLHPSSI